MNYLKKIMVLCTIFLISVFLYAQNPSGYCTVLQQPCNSDGVLVTTVTSGMTPPLYVQYYCGYFDIYDTIFSMSDTLYNISDVVYGVIITDNQSNVLFLSTGMQAPFDVNLDVLLPVCPDTMATVTANANGSLLYSAEWYFGTIDNPGTLFGIGNSSQISVHDNHYFYYVRVSDTAGCVVNYQFDDSLFHPFQIMPFQTTFSVAEASCTNGSIYASITGTYPPFYFQWSNGSTNSYMDNLTTGYYYVTITDSIGCSNEYSNYVGQSVQINLNYTVTNATCQNNNGSIIAFASGGTPPYTYNWNNGLTGQQISGLGTGGYELIVTDFNGCIKGGYTVVNSSTPLVVNYSTTASSCSSPTGSATLTISYGTPPYSVIWNTSPVQTGITAYNLSSGGYSFTVTDAVGCIRLGSVYISQDTYISCYVDSENIRCGISDGYINVNVFPPFSAPLTFNWSSGQTGPHCVLSQPGTYTCTITDNDGCTIVLCRYIGYESMMTVNLTSTPASCRFINNGTITAAVIGGTPPYTYSWSSSSGNSSVATGLAYGHYWCNVTDANGCNQSQYIYVDYNHNNDSCYCTLTGYVYIDANSNCVFDVGEQPVQNIMMHCSGNGYNFTDINGKYTFIVPSGTYQINEVVQTIYPLAPCQVNPITVNAVSSPGCVIQTNFANRINPLHDILIYATSSVAPVPGNAYNIRFNIKNAGTITEPDIVFGHNDDGQLPETSILPSIMSHPSLTAEPEWYRNHFSTISLDPGEWTQVIFYYSVPTNIPLGTTVNFYDTVAYTLPISNWLTDYTPWNNVFDTTIVVVGSYDPKEVYPAGYAPQGFIKQSDSILTYTIHFQNTGTYFAQNIYISDTISNNLDISTMEILFASHNCNISVSETGVICFSFNNINLPFTEWYGELLSSGFVTYTIKTKPNLQPGTVIENSASIFFDFNQPIFTNTVAWPEWVQSHKTNNLMLFPNPAENVIYIKSDIAISRAIIYDCSGRVVGEKSFSQGNHFQGIPVGHLASGLYLLGCEYSDHSTGYVRFNKE